jgi:hypothetical protein
MHIVLSGPLNLAMNGVLVAFGFGEDATKGTIDAAFYFQKDIDQVRS